MRRLQPQEDQDEGRNVRRRPAWWNVFNRPYWNPFEGEPRPQQRQCCAHYFLVRAFSCLSNKLRFDAHYRFKLIFQVILLFITGTQTSVQNT